MNLNTYMTLREHSKHIDINLKIMKKYFDNMYTAKQTNDIPKYKQLQILLDMEYNNLSTNYKNLNRDFILAKQARSLLGSQEYEIEQVLIKAKNIIDTYLQMPKTPINSAIFVSDQPKLSNESHINSDGSEKLLIENEIKAQDEILTHVSTQLDTLKEISINIGNELKEQDEIIDDLHQNVESTTSKLNYTISLTKRLNDKIKKCCGCDFCSNICFPIVLIIAIFLIIVIVYMLL